MSANSGESLNISTTAIRDFVPCLKNRLDYRFSENDKNILFQLATFLDPRYKGKFFSKPLIKYLQQKLLATLETELNIITSSSKENPGTIRKEHCSSLEQSMANILDSADEESENHNSDMKVKLLTEYTREKRLSRGEDPLKYWQLNNKKFEGLSLIARTYL